MTEEPKANDSREARRRRTPQQLELNMTPMIDIVFQLIIFFMIVSEFQSMELEQITLPFALKSKEITEVDRRVVINVNARGETMVMRRRYSAPELERFIASQARMHWNEEDRVSELAVKVRADAECEYHHVHGIMTRCSENGIWRVSFATNHVEDERMLGFGGRL